MWNSNLFRMPFCCRICFTEKKEKGSWKESKIFIDRITLHTLSQCHTSAEWTFSTVCSLHEVRRTCRTSPAKMKNVWRRATVEFNQMSGEAKKNFVYTEYGHSLAGNPKMSSRPQKFFAITVYNITTVEAWRMDCLHYCDRLNFLTFKCINESLNG